MVVFDCKWSLFNEYLKPPVNPVVLGPVWCWKYMPSQSWETKKQPSPVSTSPRQTHGLLLCIALNCISFCHYILQSIDFKWLLIRDNQWLFLWLAFSFVIYLNEAFLLTVLQILKEFSLLGRGELFSAFIEHARGLLKLPPSDNTSHGRVMCYM